MSRSAMLFALVLAGPTAAHAEIQRFGDVVQTLESQGAPRAASGSESQPLRVQVSYQIQEAADRGASMDAQRDSLQAAHARLYGIVGQECAVISQAFGGSCRITSLSVGNGGQSYGPVPLTTYTASATFEVAVPAAASSRPK